MKKQFTKLLFLFALLLTVSTSIWAETGTIKFGTASGRTKIDGASVTRSDSQDNSWTITTSGTTSFTNSNPEYSQVGSGSKPASSITFTATLSEAVNITDFSAKFGGFSGTQGSITLKVGDTSVGTGSLNATNDVTVSSTKAAEGNVLTITITNIAKGVKVYEINYTYTAIGGVTVEAPVLSQASGLVNAGTVVTITNKNDDLLYFYTDDGEEPTVQDLEGTGTTKEFPAEGVTINAPTTLKVVAVDEDGNMSEVVTAVYKMPVLGYTLDFETNDLSLYSDWEFTNAEIDKDAITAHGETYYATTGGKASAVFKTNKKIALPGTFTFYVSKTSNNTTASDWEVQVSSDGESWTTVGDSQSATSMSKGEWEEVTRDLSEYSDVYVRLYYSGSTAVRAVDDISLTMREFSPLASIAVDVTNAPTTFHVGDDFSHEGAVVTATYENETTKDVTTSATFSEPDMTTEGVKTVTVSYAEGGKTKTATYDIDVNAPAVLTGISLSGNYPKEFEQGDAFSCVGLVVTANYSDETTTDVTDKAEFSGYDMSALGEQTVTVSYQGKTQTYNITIVEKRGTAENPYTVAQARAAIDANEGVTVEGVYATGIVSKIVTAYNSQYGNISYNISADGTTEGEQLQAYRGKNYDGEFFTSANDIQVGDKVVIYGNLTKYGLTYEFAAGNKLVSLERANFITDAANATWVAPAKVKVLSEGVTVYTVTYDAAVRCTRKHEVADKVIPANEAVLLTSSNGEAATVKIEVTDEPATDYEDLKAAQKNDLQGSNGTVWGGTNIFCLAVGDKGLGFYPVSDEIYVPAGKAYLLIPAAQAAPSYLWFNGDTTAIDSLTTDTAAGNESGEIYSLTGQRVGKNYRGIVIMNGRKVLKK